MSRTANLLILPLILLCTAPAANAQDVSAVAEKVKSVVKKSEPCWKLYRQQERKHGDGKAVEVNWVCGKEGLIAYLYQELSVDAAAKLLYEIRTSPVGSSAHVPGAPTVDSYQFGDESFVGSYYLYTRSSYIFFRKGNIVVRIDSGSSGKTSSKRTLRNAVLFAQLFAEQMSLPNDDMHPTGNSVNVILHLECLSQSFPAGDDGREAQALNMRGRLAYGDQLIRMCLVPA